MGNQNPYIEEEILFFIFLVLLTSHISKAYQDISTGTVTLSHI